MTATANERMGIESKCEICGDITITYRRGVHYIETGTAGYVECCNPCLATGLAGGVIARTRIDDSRQICLDHLRGAAAATAPRG